MILSKKYKEEINKIIMNDVMKKRILQNVLTANENDNSAEQNMKVKTIITKVKKYNNLKRNMQMVAACSAIVLCLSVAKNFPMIYKNTSNDLGQKETAKSHDDENNDLKTIDDNEFVYNNDSREISGNKHNEDQALDQNINNSDDYVKDESNIRSKIGQEEKDNLEINSGPEVVKSQIAQKNDDKAIENSNISSKTNPVENINNKENKNPTSPELKTTPEEIKQNRIPENNIDNSVSGISVAAKEAVNYSQEYKTLDEAEKALNLKVNPLKTLPKGFKMESVNVISNEIIQVEYNDGNNKITFRSGKGIENISGDYNVYQVKNTAKVNGINITLEGNKSEEYNLASWEKDGISYSISDENGIDEKTILDMVL